MMRVYRPIYGLIFLFKYVQDPEKKNTLTNYDEELFFANQTINNACATQAILSILLNSMDKINVGDELNNLKAFTIDFSSKERGDAIGQCEQIRVAHNSFAKQEPFEIVEDKRGGKDDDVFHFISYICFKNQLYELDGLQSGPISHGACTEENWLSLARDEI